VNELNVDAALLAGRMSRPNWIQQIHKLKTKSKTAPPLIASGTAERPASAAAAQNAITATHERARNIKGGTTISKARAKSCTFL
jgi:hypothetical protein